MADARAIERGSAEKGGSETLRLARRVVGYQADAVAGLTDRLGEPFERAVEVIVGCAESDGTVLVSGLGKSGLIGAKISATLASLGIPSHFVHPTEAAHGDLGNFRQRDACLTLSYSGETAEVVALASVLRQDGIRIISITAGPDRSAAGGRVSSLAGVSDVALFVGRVEESPGAAGLSPAPMASTTATLVLGDALAECAAHRLGRVDDFHRRHPGGSLGELSKPVMDAVRFVAGSSLFVVPDDVRVTEALRLSEPPPGSALRRAGAVVLVDRATGVLTGLFTDGDLRRLVERDRSALDRPIGEVMTRNPGTLPDSALVADAVAMVRRFRRDEVPVVDAGGRPVGLLDVQDLVALKLVKEDR